MGAKVGFEGFLYYDEEGAGGTPTWLHVPNVQDLSLPLEADEAEVSTRGGGGWKQYLQGLKDASIEWSMVWDPEDTAVQAFLTAFLSGGVIGLAVMDGPVANVGSEGLWLDVVITGFNKDEALSEGQTVAITAKPAYSATAPQWKVIEE